VGAPASRASNPRVKDFMGVNCKSYGLILTVPIDVPAAYPEEKGE
jgi:hypothetical protein